jgi:molecular chaperone GrpE
MSDSEQQEPRKIKVNVKDKRVRGGADRSSDASSPSRASQSGPSPEGRIAAEASSDEATAAASAPVKSTVADEVDYLAELQRERADFENYRKRMMREVASSAGRAKAVLAEKLLPVLDNFERAISHGEGGDGVALVFKELKTALEAEGLEEVPAEGQVFDPNVHEAVMSVEDDSVDQPMVKELYRRGYRFGDQLLRAAMVVVARPADEVVKE